MMEGSQNRFQDAGAICVHFVIFGSVSVPFYALDRLHCEGGLAGEDVRSFLQDVMRCRHPDRIEATVPGEILLREIMDLLRWSS